MNEKKSWGEEMNPEEFFSNAIYKEFFEFSSTIWNKYNSTGSAF